MRGARRSLPRRERLPARGVRSAVPRHPGGTVHYNERPAAPVSSLPRSRPPASPSARSRPCRRPRRSRIRGFARPRRGADRRRASLERPRVGAVHALCHRSPEGRGRPGVASRPRVHVPRGLPGSVAHVRSGRGERAAPRPLAAGVLRERLLHQGLDTSEPPCRDDFVVVQPQKGAAWKIANYMTYSGTTFIDRPTLLADSFATAPGPSDVLTAAPADYAAYLQSLADRGSPPAKTRASRPTGSRSTRATWRVRCGSSTHADPAETLTYHAGSRRSAVAIRGCQTARNSRAEPFASPTTTRARRVSRSFSRPTSRHSATTCRRAGTPM